MWLLSKMLWKISETKLKFQQEKVIFSINWQKKKKYQRKHIIYTIHGTVEAKKRKKYSTKSVCSRMCCFGTKEVKKCQLYLQTTFNFHVVSRNSPVTFGFSARHVIDLPSSSVDGTKLNSERLVVLNVSSWG